MRCTSFCFPEDPGKCSTISVCTQHASFVECIFPTNALHILRSALHLLKTGLQSALMYGIKRSFEIIKKNHSLREKVNDHIYLFRRLIIKKNLLVDSMTPIQPLVIGDAKKAIKISNLLKELGFYVPAIRPPTVPTESARLRVSISALHSKGDIKKLAQAINKIIEDEFNGRGTAILSDQYTGRGLIPKSKCTMVLMC